MVNPTLIIEQILVDILIKKLMTIKLFHLKKILILFNFCENPKETSRIYNKLVELGLIVEIKKNENISSSISAHDTRETVYTKDRVRY